MPGHVSRRPMLMRRKPRRTPHRRRRTLLYTVLLLVGFLMFLLWADAKVRPLVGQMAKSKVHILATQMINDSVADYISGQNLQYGDMVHFEKDLEGNITALKTDMSKINAYKAAIVTNVNTRLESMKKADISIPLGNVLNGELLSGRGPEIPIRLVPYGVVDATFHNSFVSAGINQTRHQIMLDVTVDIGVLLPGSSTDTTVASQVTIAETVIVGLVPESYTHFNNGEILEKAEQYDSLLPDR